MSEKNEPSINIWIWFLLPKSRILITDINKFGPKKVRDYRPIARSVPNLGRRQETWNIMTIQVLKTHHRQWERERGKGREKEKEREEERERERGRERKIWRDSGMERKREITLRKSWKLRGWITRDNSSKKRQNLRRSLRRCSDTLD